MVSAAVLSPKRGGHDALRFASPALSRDPELRALADKADSDKKAADQVAVAAAKPGAGGDADQQLCVEVSPWLDVVHKDRSPLGLKFSDRGARVLARRPCGAGGGAQSMAEVRPGDRLIMLNGRYLGAEIESGDLARALQTRPLPLSLRFWRNGGAGATVHAAAGGPPYSNSGEGEQSRSRSQPQRPQRSRRTPSLAKGGGSGSRAWARGRAVCIDTAFAGLVLLLLGAVFHAFSQIAVRTLSTTPGAVTEAHRAQVAGAAWYEMSRARLALYIALIGAVFGPMLFHAPSDSRLLAKKRSNRVVLPAFMLVVLAAIVAAAAWPPPIESTIEYYREQPITHGNCSSVRTIGRPTKVAAAAGDGGVDLLDVCPGYFGVVPDAGDDPNKDIFLAATQMVNASRLELGWVNSFCTGPVKTFNASKDQARPSLLKASQNFTTHWDRPDSPYCRVAESPFWRRKDRETPEDHLRRLASHVKVWHEFVSAGFMDASFSAAGHPDIETLFRRPLTCGRIMTDAWCALFLPLCRHSDCRSADGSSCMVPFAAELANCLGISLAKLADEARWLVCRFIGPIAGAGFATNDDMCMIETFFAELSTAAERPFDNKSSSCDPRLSLTSEEDVSVSFATSCAPDSSIRTYREKVTRVVPAGDTRLELVAALLAVATTAGILGLALAGSSSSSSVIEKRLRGAICERHKTDTSAVHGGSRTGIIVVVFMTTSLLAFIGGIQSEVAPSGVPPKGSAPGSCTAAESGAAYGALVDVSPQQIIYQEDVGGEEHQTWNGTINGLPGASYAIGYDVLRSDLNNFNERVIGVMVGSVKLGGCNPLGSDYACDFVTCSHPASSSLITFPASGILKVLATYTGHSKDCDCNRTSPSGACMKERRIPLEGFTPTKAALRFNLELRVVAAAAANFNTTTVTKNQLEDQSTVRMPAETICYYIIVAASVAFGVNLAVGGLRSRSTSGAAAKTLQRDNQGSFGGSSTRGLPAAVTRLSDKYDALFGINEEGKAGRYFVAKLVLSECFEVSWQFAATLLGLATQEYHVLVSFFAVLGVNLICLPLVLAASRRAKNAESRAFGIAMCEIVFDQAFIFIGVVFRAPTTETLSGPYGKIIYHFSPLFASLMLLSTLYHMQALVCRASLGRGGGGGARKALQSQRKTSKGKRLLSRGPRMLLTSLSVIAGLAMILTPILLAVQCSKMWHAILGDAWQCSFPKLYFSQLSDCGLSSVRSLECALGDSGVVLSTPLPETAEISSLKSLCSVQFDGQSGLKRLPNNWSRLAALKTIQLTNTSVQNLQWELCGSAVSSLLPSINISLSPDVPCARKISWRGAVPRIRNFMLDITLGCRLAVADSLEHLDLTSAMQGDGIANDGLAILSPSLDRAFPALKSVDVARNGFTSITTLSSGLPFSTTMENAQPDGTCPLRGLAHNPITFASLRQALRIGKEKLHKNWMACLREMPHLIELDMEAIPMLTNGDLAHMIGGMQKLTSFFLKYPGTQFSAFPRNMSVHLPDLEKLDLFRIPAANPFPQGFFGSFGKLTDLSLEGFDQLIQFPGDTFDGPGLQRLATLSLVMSLGLEAFGPLPRTLPSLTELVLYRNRNLKSLPAATFSNLPNLKKLDLELTSITRLPESIGRLSLLKTLDIRGTGITSIPVSLLGSNVSVLQ